MDRQTVTLKEAQEILGIGRDRIRTAVRNGQLPSLKIGKRHVIPWPALCELLKQRTTMPPEEPKK